MGAQDQFDRLDFLGYAFRLWAKAPRQTGQAGRVLRYISEQGARGATCEEIELALGLRHQSALARLTELRKAGLVECQRIKRQSCSMRPVRVYVTRQKRVR